MVLGPLDNTILVDRDVWNALKENNRVLYALDQVGVDNWEGYQKAMCLLKDMKESEQ